MKRRKGPAPCLDASSSSSYIVSSGTKVDWIGLALLFLLNMETVSNSFALRETACACALLEIPFSSEPYGCLLVSIFVVFVPDHFFFQ